MNCSLGTSSMCPSCACLAAQHWVYMKWKHRNQLDDPVSKKAILMSCKHGTNGYCVYMLGEKSVVVSCNVCFKEHKYPSSIHHDAADHAEDEGDHAEEEGHLVVDAREQVVDQPADSDSAGGDVGEGVGNGVGSAPAEANAKPAMECHYPQHDRKATER